MEKTTNYDEIMSDRKLFNEFVYTPLSEALRLLEERQKDSVLMSKVNELLKGDIPEVLKGKKCGIQFRQIATPNNDAKNFIKISESFGLSPVFMEYHGDKFSSNNCFKRSLGKIQIQGPVNSQDEFRVEKVSVMDFNKHNGKILKDAVTSWDESLIHFHRRLFSSSDISDLKCYFCDMSKWVHEHGCTPEEYYKQFLLLFSCYGILFENFLINDEDGLFSKNIILPAIDNVRDLVGVKPIIVPIPPMDMEDDDYWTLYNEDFKKIITNSIK